MPLWSRTLGSTTFPTTRLPFGVRYAGAQGRGATLYRMFGRRVRLAALRQTRPRRAENARVPRVGRSLPDLQRRASDPAAAGPQTGRSAAAAGRPVAETGTPHGR